MHDQAYRWVKDHAPTGPLAVLDIGGRNINGSTRPLFPDATVYRTIDIAAGDGVDIVADASTWTPDGDYDVVVCTEVFEHTATWPEICRTAFEALRAGGELIATMAGPGRPPHSAIDGGWTLHPGEYYGNVDPADLAWVLVGVGFTDVVTDSQPSPADTRCTARRPE